MARLLAANGRPACGSGRVRQATVLAAVLVVAVAACGGETAPPPIVAVASPSPSPSPSLSPSPSPSPSPTPSPSPSPSPSPTPTLQPGVADLTGLKVDDAVAHRLPIVVLIDDNRIARPQSGFNGASMVYQAPADGGETRYMLVFQEGDTRDIGPVRSGRIYFVHWATEVRAAIAHYGGDLQARTYLAAHDKTLFTNVDALGKGAKAYHRISSRRPPHNGYTSSVALRAMATKLGGPAILDVAYVRRPFIDPAPLSDRPATQTVRIPYRTGLVEYRYDRSSNLYLRSLDGRAHIDPADHKRVTTTNVVVLFMPFRTDSTIEPGHARPVLGAIGEGPAWVLREGRLLKGVWRKASETDPTRLYDATGVEIPLVRGRTFFQVVPTKTTVTVRPA